MSLLVLMFLSFITWVFTVNQRDLIESLDVTGLLNVCFRWGGKAGYAFLVDYLYINVDHFVR